MMATRAMAVTFLFIPAAAAAALCLGFGDVSLQRAVVMKAEPEEPKEHL